MHNMLLERKPSPLHSSQSLDNISVFPIYSQVIQPSSYKYSSSEQILQHEKTWMSRLIVDEVYIIQTSDVRVRQCFHDVQFPWHELVLKVHRSPLRVDHL